jgi:glycosyltransferase involved in cell wall biosynthesis
MRVGFDATILGPKTRHSGGGEYAANLLRHLPNAGGDHTYVLYGLPGMERPSDLPSELIWRTLPALSLGKLYLMAAYLFLLPRLAKRDALDVFHAPTVHTRASLAPVPSGLGCKLVVTVHDLIPLTFYGGSGQDLPRKMRLFYGWNLRRALRADHILTVSETSKADILRHSGIPDQRLTAVYNGVAPPVRSQPSCQDRLSLVDVQSPYFLFVGSWEPRKNIVRLLEAFDVAVGRGLRQKLVLVVDSASGHEVDALSHAKHPETRTRVKFLHHVDEETMWALYRQAEALAYPSLYEGFGLPGVQAMACGTPVVASSCGALSEVLGDAARFVDPLDVGAIAEGLLEVGGDASLRERLSNAGIERSSRYNWQETARKTINVYEAIGR